MPVILKKEQVLKLALNIFIVKYEENKRSVSYQYKDVLTRTVEVDVFDGEGYTPLIPPSIKSTRKVRATL